MGKFSLFSNLNPVSEASALAGAVLTFLIGGLDMSIMVLFGFIAIDYITGLMVAFSTKQVSSSTGHQGIMKKIGVLLSVVVAVLLDQLIGSQAMVFRNMVVFLHIANQGISLIENFSKLGVPLPKALVDTLKQLKSENE